MSSNAFTPRHATGSRLDGIWSRTMLCAGALLGLLTVAMAALAAHLPDARLAAGGKALLRTAVEMQGWHVAALLGCGLLLRGSTTARTIWLLRASGGCFLFGIVAFCAGLYALAFAGPGAIGGIAPLGGSVLMLGWLMLFLACALPTGR